MLADRVYTVYIYIYVYIFMHFCISWHIGTQGSRMFSEFFFPCIDRPPVLMQGQVRCPIALQRPRWKYIPRENNLTNFTVPRWGQLATVPSDHGISCQRVRRDKSTNFICSSRVTRGDATPHSTRFQPKVNSMAILDDIMTSCQLLACRMILCQVWIVEICSGLCPWKLQRSCGVLSYPCKLPWSLGRNS